MSDQLLHDDLIDPSIRVAAGELYLLLADILTSGKRNNTASMLALAGMFRVVASYEDVDPSAAFEQCLDAVNGAYPFEDPAGGRVRHVPHFSVQ
jgi:hypothetical protein